jgi:hypothetical protein
MSAVPPAAPQQRTWPKFRVGPMLLKKSLVIIGES